MDWPLEQAQYQKRLSRKWQNPRRSTHASQAG